MKRLMVVVSLVLCGCTSVTVKPVDVSATMKRVCIQENPKVEVSEFIGVLRDGFDRHGIATDVITGEKSAKCDTLLTYTALRGWDFAPYLRHAELRLERDGRQIGSAEYHLNARGGFSLLKWQDTKTKMDPVIDELLQGYINHSR